VYAIAFLFLILGNAAQYSCCIVKILEKKVYRLKEKKDKIRFTTHLRGILGFLSNAKSYKFYIAILFTLTFISAAAEIFSAEIMRRAVMAVDGKDIAALQIAGVMVIVYTAVFVLNDVALGLFIRHAGNRMMQDIQCKMLDKVISLKKSRFASYKSGEIITNVITNVENAVFDGIYTLVEYFLGVFMFLGAAAYMAFVDWRMGLLVAVVNLGAHYAVIVFGKKKEAASKRAVTARKHNDAFIVDVLNNMVTVRTFHKVRYFTGSLEEKEMRLRNANVVVEGWHGCLRDITWSVSKLTEYIILYGIGGILVFFGLTNIAVISALITASSKFVWSICHFVWGYGCLKGCVPVIDSVNEVLFDAEVGDEPMLSIDADRFVIRCENMSFGFGETEILKDVNLTIKENEKVMIKGANGSGKSTLLNLIAGLYKPTSGGIYYGDYEISVINLDSVSDKYLYITQDSNMLDGTVCENMALSRQYDDVRCRSILADLNLDKIYDSAPKLLSQGEKQRLNIGRALYRKKEISLILGDEIFASIDKENILAITQLLEREFADKTVIFVCHENIAYTFDRVIHVEAGIVREAAILSEGSGTYEA